jgi:hypothetical protein
MATSAYYQCGEAISRQAAGEPLAAIAKSYTVDMAPYQDYRGCTLVPVRNGHFNIDAARAVRATLAIAAH